MIIKHPPNYFQGSIAGLESSLLLQSEEKKSLESSSKSLSDPQKSLKQLEQLSWNVDRTGEIGKWDIAQATNFQVDPEKHPYLNAALRGVNNTTGFVACVENVAANAAGTILFDLPAAIEDLSVEHGGPSFEELAFSMQGAIPVVPDEAVPYVLGRLSSVSRGVRVLEKIFDDPKLKIVTDPIEREVLIDKLVFSAEQIQKKFKHANVFGVQGNYNKANAAVFEGVLNDHFRLPRIMIIFGEYHGKRVIHFLDPFTRNNLLFSEEGSFISGWKLSEAQYDLVIKTGKLGGN